MFRKIRSRLTISPARELGESPLKPVDTSLRLRGASGLRVADASVIPWTPVSALNAPSMLIGYRAAKAITEQA
ncbi:MAG: GMC oxidoreductase [Polyangiales bacterium]